MRSVVDVVGDESAVAKAAKQAIALDGDAAHGAGIAWHVVLLAPLQAAVGSVERRVFGQRVRANLLQAGNVPGRDFSERRIARGGEITRVHRPVVSGEARRLSVGQQQGQRAYRSDQKRRTKCDLHGANISYGDAETGGREGRLGACHVAQATS